MLRNRLPRGKTLPSFENVHIYPYMTELQRPMPAKVDRERGRLARVIRDAR